MHKSEDIQDKDKMLETAAAATNEPTNSTSQPRVRGIYDREITHKDRLRTTDGKFPYVASLKSAGPGGSQAGRHQCLKCKYYGHFEGQCHQKPLRIDNPESGSGSA